MSIVNNFNEFVYTTFESMTNLNQVEDLYTDDTKIEVISGSPGSNSNLADIDQDLLNTVSLLDPRVSKVLDKINETQDYDGLSCRHLMSKGTRGTKGMKPVNSFSTFNSEETRCSLEQNSLVDSNASVNSSYHDCLSQSLTSTFTFTTTIDKEESKLTLMEKDLTYELYKVCDIVSSYVNNFDVLKRLIMQAVSMRLEHVNLAPFFILWIEHDPTNQQLVKTLNEFLSYTSKVHKKLTCLLMHKFICYFARSLSMQRIEENLGMIKKVIRIARQTSLFEDPQFYGSFSEHLRTMLFEQSVGYSFQHTLFADETLCDSYVFPEVRELLDWLALEVSKIIIDNCWLNTLMAHKFANFPAQKMLYKLRALYRVSKKTLIYNLITKAIDQINYVKKHKCTDLNCTAVDFKGEYAVSSCNYTNIRESNSWKIICKAWGESKFEKIEYKMKPYKYVLPSHPGQLEAHSNCAEAFKCNSLLPAHDRELDRPLTPADVFMIVKLEGVESMMTGLTHNTWKSLRQSSLYGSAYQSASTSGGRVYLMFSMRFSSKFQAIAEMTSDVDINGVFGIKWICLKDVSNVQFRHIKVPSTSNGVSDYKEVSASPDGQVVDYRAATDMWNVFKKEKFTSSILDYFYSTKNWK